MSTAILKSPVYIDQRLLVAPSAVAVSSMGASIAVSAQPGSLADTEARLRDDVTLSLKAEFDARWAAEREKAYADGYQAGLVEGHDEGKHSAQEAFRKKQSMVETLLAQVEAEAEQWRQSVQQQAYAVAKLALCELLGESALSPTFLEALIRRVTHGLRDQDIVSVRLHPSDARLLREACAARAEVPPSATALALADRLLDDAQVETGGVVIDTPRGEYQATLATLLGKLVKLVEQQRAQHSGQDQVPHVRLA